MRFNEKYTCIDFFENGIPDNLVIPKKQWPIARQEMFKKEIAQAFNLIKDECKKKIQYITDPFYSAYKKAEDKIEKVLKEESMGVTAGTFILSCGDGVVKTAFYIFNHENDKSKDYYVYLEFTKSKDTNIVALGAAIQIIRNNEEVRYFMGDGYDQFHVNADLLLTEFVQLCGFLKYCDLEVKVLTPKEKHRAAGVKYFNETKSNIEILDSTWFTTTIRTGVFDVEGHFRLQPYGPGFSKRKWIYIKDFVKTGYTLRSKKSITE